MKLPASVQIGHLRVTVSPMTDRGTSRKHAVGWYDDERAEIEVLDTLTPQIKAEILLHEMLHCALAVANSGLDGEEEERVVSGLAPVLLMMMRDNPDVFAALVEAMQ
jgi:hypothetical protein